MLALAGTVTALARRRANADTDADTSTVINTGTAKTTGTAANTGAAGQAGLLFTLSAVFVLIPPAVFATFDWRYQLPQLTLIPVAAVLAVTAVRTASDGTSR